jgi:F-type H+-transporting ATPase subunit b
VKEVRDQAIVIAVGAARDIIANQMTAAEGNTLIDDAISQVDKNFH